MMRKGGWAIATTRRSLVGAPYSPSKTGDVGAPFA